MSGTGVNKEKEGAGVANQATEGTTEVQTTSAEHVPPPVPEGLPPPPSSYAQGTSTSCSYVDFCPTCLSQGGFASMPVFERFE